MKKVNLSFLIILLGLNLSAQKNIFEETFKNTKNKWALFSSVNKDSATLNVLQGQLVIESKQKGPSSSLIKISNKKININTDEEVTISVALKHISGTNLSAYGILFGEKLANDKFNGFEFSITDNGYYKLYATKNEKNLKYKGWTPTEAIKKDNAENILTIVKKRNQFHFLINSQWLFYIDNDNSIINSIGVVNTGNQKIAFANIKIESFIKITDKKEQDKINDLTTIVQQSQNLFINAYSGKADQLVTWLPYMNEENKNVNILFNSYPVPVYQDNWSYEKAEAETRVKQYTKYIEKVLGQFEKIEKPNVLGKKTFWLSKNSNYAEGTYILLDEFSISDNYHVKFVVANDKTKTKEEIEKMKD